MKTTGTCETCGYEDECKSCKNCNLYQLIDYSRDVCMASGEPVELVDTGTACPFWVHDGIN